MHRSAVMHNEWIKFADSQNNTSHNLKFLQILLLVMAGSKLNLTLKFYFYILIQIILIFNI